MPLVPKNAGAGAAALAAIVAQAKAATVANTLRQIAATAPVPVPRTTERNSSAYYGYSRPEGNVVVNAPPVNGGQASEFYAPPPRTMDRNSSAFFNQRPPVTVYQPPVNGGQASEFYTPPRPYYGPTAFGPSGAMGPPAPSQSQPRIMPGGPQSSGGADPRFGTQVLQTDPGPQRTPDPTAYYPVPQSMATAQVPPKSPPGLPPSFARSVQGFEQDEQLFRWRERRVEELDAEIENLRKIMRDGGGNRASSTQLAQWVNEREQLLTGVYGNENTGILDQLGEGIQAVRDFGPQDMGPLKPLGEAVEALWDDPRVQTVKDGVIWAFEHADIPRQFVTGKFGDALVLLAMTAPEAIQSLSFIPGMDDFQRFVEEANLRNEIMDWYVNGYNGFTGGRAVWEGLIGKTDDLPWYLKYPIRITTDLVMDPLSYVFMIGRAGRGVGRAGEALATLPDASRAEQVVGRTMQAMGRGTDIVAHGADNLFVDVPIRAIRKGGSLTGVGRPAAFDLSERALHTRAVTEVTGAARRSERALAAAGKRPPAPTETLTVPEPPPSGATGAATPTSPQPGGGDWPTWPTSGQAAPSATSATPQKPKPVDRPAVVTAAGDIVDPPTGQLLPAADDIPKDLPNLRRAAARSVVPDEPRTGGGFRKKGDDFSAPRVDGTRLQDRIATGGLRALANGDTKTARLFENELAKYEAKAAAELGDNPLFLNWDEGGAPIRVSATDAPFTDEELALFRTASDGTVLDETEVLSAATKTRDGGLGGALQLAHMLHFESYHLDAFRRLFPGTDLPTGANSRFRINAEAPGSFRDERLYWLMEEFVTTPDPARARAIAEVLNNPTGPLLRLAPNGNPYLTAIPSRVKRPGANMSIRSEVSTLLHAARKNWDEARATIHKPDVVAQARGGLKAENKRMADAIENAIETEARLKREALQKLAADGQGEAVIARFQWKIDPGSNWKRGMQTELRRHKDGTYHVWSKPGNKRTFEDWGELGDPNGLSADVTLYKTPDEYIQGMKEKGDRFNPATGERDPWAMELAPWETWNDPEVVRHRKSFDAGPSSPDNMQYLGRYHPEREATEHQLQDTDLAGGRITPANQFESAVPAGHTRLYRVETDPAKVTSGYVPDEGTRFLQDQYGITGARGRWFTVGHPPKMRFYWEESGADKARIVYVDVPNDQLDQFRVSNIPQVSRSEFTFGGENPRQFSIDPENEFFVSRGFADQKQVFRGTMDDFESVHPADHPEYRFGPKKDDPEKPKIDSAAANREVRESLSRLRGTAAAPATPGGTSPSTKMGQLPVERHSGYTVEHYADYTDVRTRAGGDSDPWVYRVSEDRIRPGTWIVELDGRRSVPGNFASRDEAIQAARQKMEETFPAPVIRTSAPSVTAAAPATPGATTGRVVDDVTPPAAGAGDEAFEEIRDAWNVAYANSERAWRKSKAAWDTPQYQQAYDEWEQLSEITQRLEAQMDEAERALRGSGDDFVSRNSGPLGVAAPPLPGTRFLGRIKQGLDAQIEPSVIPTFDDIVNDDLRWPLELGVNEANWEDAKLLDQVLDGWQPPKKVPGKTEWRVLEAWQEVERVAAIDPTFNLGKAKFEIALRAKGIPIKEAGKRTAVDWIDRKYDGFMNVIQREHRRYGPLTALRNAIGDTVGTMHQGIATGNIPDAFDTLTTARALPSYRSQEVKRNPILWAESQDDSFVRGTGQFVPAEMMPMSSRGEDPFGGFPTLNARVAHRNKVIRGAANIWTVPLGKDYLTLVDLVSRTSNWKRMYKKFLQSEGMKPFAKLLLNTANGDALLAKQWSDLIEIEARKHAGSYWDGSFSPNDIAKALDGQTPQNHALSRAWQRETNIASQKAVQASKSVYFSFENLNIDEYMRKVFVFHYWQTRAYPLHVRAALRNPVLLNGYYKIYEELQQIAEEQGYPPFMKDMFRFFGTKDGLAGFGSILGVLLPTTILDAYSEQGNKYDVFINQMSPMIAGALAVAGITDRPPNATALRNDMNFIRKFTNFMIGQGYDPASLPVIGGWFEPNTLKFTIPEEEILNQLIGAANSALQRLNLGPIQAGEYTPFDRGANELDQLATWVEVVATEQFGRPMLDAQGNIQWTDEEMALFEQALDGMQTGMDSNPILNEAIERQGKEDGLGAMLNLIAPGGGVVNSQARTDLQAADKRGDQNADLMRDIATATDPTWVIANERYHQLGDSTSQANLKLYNTILNDLESLSDQQYLIRRTGVGGDEAFIDLRPLLDMSYDERKEYLNQLFAWSGELNGIQQLQAERDAFKQANPEYATYLTYQKGAYSYEDKPGGIKAWRTKLAGDNPNFARAMQNQREYLESIGKKGAVLEAELDQWAAGQEAFHAAMGEQFNLYDDEPTRTYDPSNDPLQSSALSFMVPETDQGFTAQEGEADKPEKGSAEDLQQRFAENDQNFAFANRAAEELYGDSWDYDAVAQSGDPKQGWMGSGKKPEIAYWPSGSSPGDTTLQDRYAEWKRMMLAAGVPRGQLTIQDWIDWEAGLQAQYFPEQNPYPDLWQPWLEEEQRRTA